jgi:DNA transformation protein and related proteins
MDADDISELFSGVGPVRVRRMFSGFGIFTDGMMFALVIRDVVYLKTDDAASSDFAREGLAPFEYLAKGRRRVITSYWRMPDRLYDDPDELAEWGRRAIAVARRAAEKKVKPPTKPKRSSQRKSSRTSRRRNAET